MRAAKRKDNSDYYEYVLLYVDDCLAIGVDPESILRHEIGKYFQLKEESIGEPTIYLRGTCSKVEVNGVPCWAFSSSQYVQAACKNVKKYLEKLNKDLHPKDQTYFLPKRANAPFGNNYRPEIDVSAELSPEFAAYYQSLIGILRWMVELGRVDITAEVLMMSSCLALLREGHLKALFHMF